jgi:DNA polymerase III epsilon subunit-like protein
MNYIVLDLEWNQAYVQKAIAVQKRLASRLRGEVIQIGAVKLDEHGNICGSYSINVKPKYFCKIHRHVMSLTGITQEMMDMGAPLPDAIESFFSFCGEDSVFLTWGPDDIPMLKDNMIIHAINTDKLDRYYDLQVIFNAQTDGAKQQRSLEYAMDYFELEQTLPAHDALNDAYFTALVAQKLNLSEGIKLFSERTSEFLLDETYGDSNIGEDGYVEINEFLDSEDAILSHCPICCGALERTGKTLHCKGHKYVTLYSCKEDGELFLNVKMLKNFDESYRAHKTVVHADDDAIESYQKRLEENQQKRKKRVRRPHRTQKQNAQITQEQSLCTDNA